MFLQKRNARGNGMLCEITFSFIHRKDDKILCMYKFKLIISLVLFFLLFTSFNMNIEMEKCILVIHGGAGYISEDNLTKEKQLEYEEALKNALQKGYELLSSGGTSLDAIEVTIKELEDSPLFNAGKGSVFTNEEMNEMDASIMDGKTLNAGAVACVTNIKNPISAAKSVLQNSEHVLLTGKGAEAFAKEQKLEIVDSEYFKVEERLKRVKEIKKSEKIELDHSKSDGHINITNPDEKYGTVGAAALDKKGNLASGTSTGGMTNKKYNRVGDSPLIGSGTYANNKTCAVSCTGHGEYFIRSVVAYDVSALMEYKGYSLDKAANYVVNEKLVELKGAGGLIAIDKEGNVAMPFNTPGMFRGYVTESGKIVVKMFKE
jgi:beta-aspartyl-peptidase (threonine type)